MIQSIEEGRKEYGNRSIADKIKKRLHNLEKTVENNRGRWAWELLQNAKDSVADYTNRKISVQIELDENQVVFRHNGIHFTEKDIRGLINQISSKEVEEGEPTNRTGRFGTGFLTTHLLSKVIDIKGIVETENKQFFKFEFPLDRDGKSITELVPKIENAWRQFHSSVTLIENNYNENNYNTSFTYHLKTEEQKKIAKVGTEEFMNLIPYVLTFIPNIDKVEILNNLENKVLEFKNNQEIGDENIYAIEKKENGIPSLVHILNARNSRLTIATEIKKNEKGYFIKNNKDIPRLFCDFPLIGTEKFYFPIIINSFYFNPQVERDGIWLKGNEDLEVQENQSLLKEALELYKALMDKVSSSNFYNLFNISDSRLPITDEKYFDEGWYSDNIQTPLREYLFEMPIIESENEIKEKQSPKDAWFPLKSYSIEVQKKLWQFTYDIYPTSVCKKEHIQEWVTIYWNNWNKITYEELSKDLEDQESIDKLSETLNKNKEETFIWYNEVIKFIYDVEENRGLFESRKILPNKNGIFNKKQSLFIDKIKDSKLILILKLLGDDWNEKLIHSKVKVGSYYGKKKKDIAGVISSKLNSPNIENVDVIDAISLLSEWFDNNNPKDSKEYFGELYRKRAQLFMNTIPDKESLYKVMRSKTNLEQLSKVAEALEKDPDLIHKFNQTEEFSSLLKEYNVATLNELKTVLESSNTTNFNHSKAEITQEDLAGLGVSSMEELEEALKDKDLASLFNHTSMPNANMFLYAQQLITRSKENIKKHLVENSDYDCTDMEELATTVLAGVKKQGIDIHIVIRPSDNGQVIVWYSSEKDTLDYANAELWIDDGKKTPRHLTLGNILKTTGINKIPV